MCLKKFFYSPMLSLLICSSVIVVADPSYENYVLTLSTGITKNPSTKLFDDKAIKLQLEAILVENRNLVPESQREGAFYAYTNFSSGDIYYTFNNTAILINSFNLSNLQYLGGWKLETYPQIALEPELDNLGIQSTYEYRDEPGSGCLLEHPLRYSDLDLDGKKELIVLLGGSTTTEFIIFSTDLKKVVFSAPVVINHAFTPGPEEIEVLWPDYGAPDDYQYLSDLKGGSPPPMEMGISSFAKLFFGDFNNDNVFDIVVWRKYFESRKISDPIKGFEKKNELLIHYQVVNGDYKKQPTDQTTVKSWLTTHNQTWKKGYPNNSECANQPNQLIPEMHDALLNDPEVLQ